MYLMISFPAFSLSYLLLSKRAQIGFVPLKGGTSW